MSVFYNRELFVGKYKKEKYKSAKYSNDKNENEQVNLFFLDLFFFALFAFFTDQVFYLVLISRQEYPVRLRRGILSVILLSRFSALKVYRADRI